MKLIGSDLTPAIFPTVNGEIELRWWGLRFRIHPDEAKQIAAELLRAAEQDHT